MSAIRLQQDHQDTATRVPNIFIDQYMTMANGEFVKVYLYLLRSASDSSSECSISDIADHCSHTEKDVLRALHYWEKAGLLRLDYDKNRSICGVTLLNPDGRTPSGHTAAPASAGQSLSGQPSASEPVSAPAASEPVSAPAASNRRIIDFPAADSSRHEYTADEIGQFRRDPAVAEFLCVTEVYLKHTLGASEVNTILYWYDGLHFQPDLIIYLVEYCISKGHSSIRYMDKVALGWSDDGITSVEEARKHTAARSRIYYDVMKALGISGRSMTDDEALYVQRWTKEYGFDRTLILEACRRTIAATHQSSFAYTDAILSDWHKNQVHTLQDVQALDTAHARNHKSALPPKETARRGSKFNNFNQRDYDYDKLEQVLLNTTVQ